MALAEIAAYILSDFTGTRGPRNRYAERNMVNKTPLFNNPNLKLLGVKLNYQIQINQTKAKI